ncbi:MAG: glycerophosphodiester phosphodiesterase family protein, partial [Dyadobacter sp.]
MKISSFNFSGYFSALLFFINLTGNAQNNTIQLIAHRGGVVDSTFTENGLPALKKAVENKYAMIETDIRVTKDGILITNHDANFERYYGLKEKVTDMNWMDIQKLSSKLDGNTPLKLETVLQFCTKNHINVMLDNKIEGLDIPLFNQLLALLDQYNLRKKALMIGTDASTEFFTGKIKLSCTRKQLEENIARKDYKPDHYFLFERPAKITKDDVDWALKNKIMVVAAINKYHYKNSENMYREAKDDCSKMMS